MKVSVWLLVNLTESSTMSRKSTVSIDSLLWIDTFDN